VSANGLANGAPEVHGPSQMLPAAPPIPSGPATGAIMRAIDSHARADLTTQQAGARVCGAEQYDPTSWI